MATKVNVYLDNVTSDKLKPNNWQELQVELNFDRDKDSFSQTTTVTNLEFVRDGNDEILKHVESGLSTGVGVFEGKPLRIELERDGNIEKLFNGYLDFTESEFGRTRSIVKAVESYNIDWLNDVADSFTFEYLYREIGSITNNDFTKVPYIINSVPNYTDAAIGVVSVYVMVKEIRDAIQRLIEFVADLPVYYVFSTYIKLILYIIYLILLIIALIKLVKNVILLIIQPVKYHSGMSVLTMLQKGCEYLGITLKAPDFETEPFNRLYIIPEKYYNPVNKKESQILGITDPKINQEGFFKGTFGDLLRHCKTLINGKIQFINNELWLVRKDYDISNPQYILPEFYNDKFKLNTNEFVSNMVISFQTDLSDRNTIQYYKGVSYQTIIQPQRVNNSNMVLMKHLDEINIPFARGITKTELTIPEKIFSGFLKVFQVIVGALVTVVNAVITVLNIIITLVNNILKKLATIGIKLNFQLPTIPKMSVPDFANLFENRKGMLIVEKDLFTIPKMLILRVAGDPKFTKIHESNDTILSAKYIYEHFYYVNSFMPNSDNQNGNQYYIKEYEKIPFTFSDFEKVKRNNRIFTHIGERAEVNSLKWNPWNQSAYLSIRINKLYTNNLTLLTYEPTGE